MAGRQFNKLRKQLGEDLPRAPASESWSCSEEEEGPSQAPFNPFDLLAASEGEEHDAAAQSEEEGDEEQGGAAASSGPPGVAAAARPAGAKKKAKKKKKGGKAGMGAEAEPDALQQEQEARSDEDIDEIIKELGIKVATGPSSDAANTATPSAAAAVAGGRAVGPGGGGGSAGERPLLGVDTRHLRAEEELKRMFGRVAEAEEEEGRGDAFAGASRRVRRLAARGLLQRVPLKRGALITPRETWPRFDGGVSMEYVGVSPEGQLRFTYAYSQAYQAVQELYEQCQASFDPNNVAALLHSHPYHLDALLTMTDLYRSMGENAYADEMLERCVYACEMAWHPSLNLAAANFVVPFDEPNKPLFLSLFKYQQALSRRGLHKTALEVCKLLLALNPDDPMGVLFALDYLAVRAGRYSFLQRFAQQYGGGDQAVQLYPNIVYSLALARWYQEQDQEGGKRGRAGGSGSGGSRTQAQPAAAADVAVDESKSSNDLLTKAVLLYPVVVARLVRKLQEKGTGKDADWAYLLSQPLLRDAGDGGSASLGHLVDLFVERQHLLWKAQPIQEWLKAACRRAQEGSDLPDGVAAADWACVREQAFPVTEDNAYRHLRLYEFSDTVQRIPPEDLHGVGPAAAGGGGGGGLLAGIRAEDMAAMEAELRQLEARVAAEGAVPEEYLREGNPLMMLIRSMLPWFNAGQQPDYEADEGQQQQRQQGE